MPSFKVPTVKKTPAGKSWGVSVCWTTIGQIKNYTIVTFRFDVCYEDSFSVLGRHLIHICSHWFYNIGLLSAGLQRIRYWLVATESHRAHCSRINIVWFLSVSVSWLLAAASLTANWHHDRARRAPGGLACLTRHPGGRVRCIKVFPFLSRMWRVHRLLLMEGIKEQGDPLRASSESDHVECRAEAGRGETGSENVTCSAL